MNTGIDSPLANCPGCGAPTAGGWEGCQALWDSIVAKAHTDLVK